MSLISNYSCMHMKFTWSLTHMLWKQHISHHQSIIFLININNLLFYSSTIQRLNENPIMRGAFWILGKTYVFFFMPHCFLPFALLTPVSRIWSAIRLTGGLGYVFFGSSFLWIPLIKTALRKPRTDAEPSAKKENWVFINLKTTSLNIIKTILCDETMHNIMIEDIKKRKKDPNNLSQTLFEILLLLYSRSF